jgi:NADH-quinone oxidoreductase subunit C
MPNKDSVTDTMPSKTPGVAQQQVKLAEALDVQFGDLLIVLPSHAWQEFGITRGVKREHSLEVMRKLRDHERFLFNMLIDITCVDWLGSRQPRFEVVYQLLSLTYNHRLVLKIAVLEEQPEVDSVRRLWPAANFLEREVWDMFGIKFTGHGDLRRILMYDEFIGHALRKDYPLKMKQPRVKLRSPELHNTSADMHRPKLSLFPGVRKSEQGEV